MPRKEVAYLGPLGTYSHLVVEKRFGRGYKLVPLPTILDICTYVSGHPHRLAVVPIENSSGGAIYETVDILMEQHPPVHIMEELSLDVKLALLGHQGGKIKSIYSHFAPLEHCDPWLKQNYPQVQRQATTSTAAAAQMATRDMNSAALGNRRLAALYGLTVMRYPSAADVPNLTVFLLVTGTRPVIHRRDKTTLAVALPNKPGSLCNFLEVFRRYDVNLTKLLSRPLRGRPREYAFLVDMDGGTSNPKVRHALTAAKKTCVTLRVVGSFPCRTAYKS